MITASFTATPRKYQEQFRFAKCLKACRSNKFVHYKSERTKVYPRVTINFANMEKRIRRIGSDRRGAYLNCGLIGLAVNILGDIYWR
jgi:hypothetical protein